MTPHTRIQVSSRRRIAMVLAAHALACLSVTAQAQAASVQCPTEPGTLPAADPWRVPLDYPIERAALQRAFGLPAACTPPPGRSQRAAAVADAAVAVAPLPVSTATGSARLAATDAALADDVVVPLVVSGDYFLADGAGDSSDLPQVLVGEEGLAAGKNAVSSASGAVAVGSAAEARGSNSVAIGQLSNIGFSLDDGGVAGDVAGAIALGYNARVFWEGNDRGAVGAISIGMNSRTNASGATALGSEAKALADDALAIGAGTQINAAEGIGIGASAQIGLSSATASVALGARSEATEANTVSIGSATLKRRLVNLDAGTAANDAVNKKQLDDAIAGVAAGDAPFVKADGDVLAGDAEAVVADGTKSVALGVGSVADQAGTVSVGNSTAQRRIVNVAAGTTDTDAVNLKQLGDAISAIPGSDALSWDTSASAWSATHGGSAAKLTNLANGTLAAASTDAVTGDQLFSVADSITVALGASAAFDPVTGVVTGPTYTVRGSPFTDVASAVQALDTAIGNISASEQPFLKADGDVAGGDAEAVVTPATKAVALGANASATANNAVALGAGSVADVADTVSVGSTGSERRIVNVADGRGGSDAVTINQLSLAGIVINATGGVVTPVVTYSDASRTEVTLFGAAPVAVRNVAAGTADTDAVNRKQLDDAIDAIPGSDALPWDAGAGVWNANHAGAASKLTNLANGAVLQNSSDAMTGDQLWRAGSSVALALGGTAEFNTAAGVVMNQRFIVRGTNYGDVTGAIEALDTAIGDIAVGEPPFLKADGDLAGGDVEAAVTANTKAVALGANATATANNAVAIGAGSVADVANTVSIGSAGSERRIVNLAAGTAATDAVNKGQLDGVDTRVTANADAITGLTGRVGTAETNITTINATAVFYDAAAGDVVTLKGAAGTQLKNVAAGTDGNDAVNKTQLDTAIGAIPVADALLWESTAWSANHGGSAAKLTNLAVGTLGTTSSDAVTGAQLYSVADSIRIALGSTAVFDPVTGVVTGPSYTVQGSTYSSVLDAVGALDTAIDGIAVGEPPFLKADGDLAGGDVEAAVTAGTKAVALGANASATANNAVALGAGSVADVANTVSIGSAGNERRIVNLAAGTATTDAVNKGQLDGVDTRVTANADAITGLTGRVGSAETNLTTINDTAVFYDAPAGDVLTLKGASGTQLKNVAAGTDATDAVNKTQLDTAIGAIPVADALLWDSTAWSANHLGAASKLTNLAAGTLATTSSDAVTGAQLYSVADSIRIALGAGAVFDASTGVVTGPTYNVRGTPYNDVAAAVQALDTAIGSIVVGEPPFLKADGDVAGGDAEAVAVAGTKAVALGANATATANNAVAIGAGSVADAANTVSIGSAGSERRIVNVAAGTAATDAVNKGQLDGVDTRVTANADAITGLTGRVGTAETNITTINDTAVFYDAGAGDVVTLKGTSGTQLKNLAAGTDGTDAVNKTQLDAVDTRVTANATAITGLTGRVGTAETNITTINDTAVFYDAAAGDVLTFKGSAGTQLKNVAAGTDGTDAVNKTQLDAAIGAIPVADALLWDSTAWSANHGGSAAKLTNLAVGTLGTASTDAVTGAQLYSVADSIRIALGSTAVFDPATGVVTGPSYTVQGSTYSSVLDAVGALDTAIDGIAVGEPPFLKADGDLAGGDVEAAVTANTKAVALGANASATAANAVALGAGSVADVADTVSVGSSTAQRRIVNLAQGTGASDAVAVSQLLSAGLVLDAAGNVTTPVVTYSSAAKTEITLGNAGSPVLLKNLADGVDDSDAVNLAQVRGLIGSGGGDALPWNAGLGAWDAVRSGAPARLSNLAPGVLGAASSDAVTGAQLSAMGNSIASIFGGGAAFNADGSFTAPTYQLGTTAGTATTVEAALANVDDRVVVIEQGGAGGSPPTYAADGAVPAQAAAAQALASGSNARALAANSVALGANALADRANTVSVGAAGAERQVANVADGSAATDAVNVRQMQRNAEENLARAKQYADEVFQRAIETPTKAIDALRGEMNENLRQMDERINRQGAMSAATAHMTASAANIQTSNRLAVGIGTSEGRQAMSVGFQRQLSTRVSFSMGAAFSGSEQSAGAGVGVGW